ncbi:hypothetical protein VTI74DRAFT_547 [Chaetomium olivicolor]
MVVCCDVDLQRVIYRPMALPAKLAFQQPFQSQPSWYHSLGSLFLACFLEGNVLVSARTILSMDDAPSSFPTREMLWSTVQARRTHSSAERSFGKHQRGIFAFAGDLEGQFDGRVPKEIVNGRPTAERDGNARSAIGRGGKLDKCQTISRLRCSNPGEPKQGCDAHLCDISRRDMFGCVAVGVHWTQSRCWRAAASHWAAFRCVPRSDLAVSGCFPRLGGCLDREMRGRSQF